MSSVFVCSDLVDGVCHHWVEQSSLLPALTVEDGALLGGSVFLVYVLAWGFSLLCRQLLNQW